PSRSAWKPPHSARSTLPLNGHDARCVTKDEREASFFRVAGAVAMYTSTFIAGKCYTEPMSAKSLEFFFDYTCPFAYLGSTQARAVAERMHVDCTYRPFLLGGVLKATG